MNKQKDRLVELLKETRCERSCDGFKNIEVCNGCTAYERYAESADRILADGWLRPPFKIGDKVTVVDRRLEVWWEGEVASVGYVDENNIQIGVCYDNCEVAIRDAEDVFLSREEAEAKLVTDKNVGSKKKEGVQG